MLTIYYNENTGNKTFEGTLKIELRNNKLTCHYKVDNEEENKPANAIDYDVIEKMAPYNSYALVKRGNYFPIKVGRMMELSTCQWLNLNRLGVAIKEDFGRIPLLYDYSVIAQVDTGMVAESYSDVVINVVGCAKDDIEVNSDLLYELKDVSTLEGKYPRETLWDNYALAVNGREYKANRWGDILQGDNTLPLVCEDGKDYIDFTITKYKGYFTDERLERAIDDEDVLIETSAGLCNPIRVKLQNGVGSFRLYPFSYDGPVKIKLGRKWYTVWNDYSFTLG